MANMIHVKPKGAWKKVKIDPTVFPKADLEGLISLEELTDYEIVKNSAESANKTSGKVRKLIKSRSLALQVIVFHKSFAIFISFYCTRSQLVLKVLGLVQLTTNLLR